MGVGATCVLAVDVVATGVAVTGLTAVVVVFAVAVAEQWRAVDSIHKGKAMLYRNLEHL